MKKIALALCGLSLLFFVMALIFPGFMVNQRSRRLTAVIAQEYSRMTRTRVQAAEVESLEQFRKLYPREATVMSQTTRAVLEQQEGKYQVATREAVARFIYVKKEHALMQFNYVGYSPTAAENAALEEVTWAHPLYSNGVKNLWHSASDPPMDIDCQYGLKMPFSTIEEHLLKYNFAEGTFRGFFMPIVEGRNGIALSHPDMDRLAHVFQPSASELYSRWQMTLYVFSGLSLVAALILFLLKIFATPQKQVFPRQHSPQGA